MPPSKKANLIKFALHCALAIWPLCIFSFNFVMPFIEGDGLSWRNPAGDYFGSDFLHYYVSGVMARSVDRQRIYDVPVHYPYMNSLIAPREITKNSCINFSPPMIVIMSVISLLPIVPAFVLWTSASFVFGAFGLYVLLKRVDHLSQYQRTLFIIFTAESLCSIVDLRMGQWTWWLIGLLCFFFYLSLEKRQALSGISLGLLIVKPQYCLPLLILTAIEKRWLTLFSAACVMAIFFLLATSLIGLDNVLHYPQILAALITNSDMSYDLLCHCSIRGLLARYLPQTTVITTVTNLYLIASGALAVQCLLQRKRLKDNIHWFWAISILVALIFSPHMFVYDALLVGAAAALTLKTINPLQITQLKPLSLKIWHWTFFLYPLFTWARSFLGNDFSFIYAFVHAILLFCAIGYLRYRAKEEKTFLPFS